MRRYAIALAACMMTALLCGTAGAQEQKIGYIDTGKIFAEFQETVEAEEVYAKEVDAWKQKADEMQTELAQMRESLQSQSLMLSEEKIAEKKLEFDQKLKEYEQYMEEIFGDNGEAARRNRELTQPIVEKINGVIATIAKEQGYTLILDASQGNIVYGIKDIDLTEAVLARLQEQMESIQ